MAEYTPLSGVTVDAFQWNGDPIGHYDLPGWALTQAGLNAPGIGTVEVRCYDGTSNAKPGDWIVRYGDGSIDIVPDALFRFCYDVEAVEKKQAADTKREEAKATNEKKS